MVKAISVHYNSQRMFMLFDFNGRKLKRFIEIEEKDQHADCANEPGSPKGFDNR